MNYFLLLTSCLLLNIHWGYAQTKGQAERPNFIIILTDDQRWDALGASGNPVIHTPTMDSLARSGVYFPNAFVTLSICTPSRAAVLTGQYGSKNGVMDMQSAVRPDVKSIAHYLKDAGYQTSVFGKWHLPNSPKSMGFDHEFYFEGLVPYWDVTFMQNEQKIPTKGFVDDASARRAITYLQEIRDTKKSFFMFFNTFAPHMDNSFGWPVREKTLACYPQDSMPLPATWQEDFQGKPSYLKKNRPHQQALDYGYANPDSIQKHVQGYFAATTDMDAALDKLLNAVSRLGLAENTYILLMGDNGWFMGEHGLTSKVLAYEESIRVPLIVTGPEVKHRMAKEMMLNIDLMPTVLELAGLQIPSDLDGKSFTPLLFNKSDETWRKSVFYEAPHAVHGTMPHYAIRTKAWKLIQTYDVNEPDERIYEELYHLSEDPDETKNLAGKEQFNNILNTLRAEIQENIKKSKAAAGR